MNVRPTRAWGALLACASALTVGACRSSYEPAAPVLPTGRIVSGEAVLQYYRTGDVTYEDLSNDLARLITQLELRRPILIGHSMGAATVAHLAAHRPELVSGIIVEDPPWWKATFDDSPKVAKKHVAGWIGWVSKVKASERDAAVAECRKKHARWSAGDCEGWVYSEKKVSLDFLRRFTSGGLAWNKFLGDIAAPALLVYAERGIVKDETARIAERTIRGLKAVRIEKSGHSIHRDRFEEFLAAVVGFLEEVHAE